MAKIVLSDVASGYNRQRINENFQALEDELNNKVLYRDNPAGQPNVMVNDLDMNSNDVLNAGTVAVQVITLDGVNYSTVLDGKVTEASGFADASEASSVSSAGYASNSSASATVSSDAAAAAGSSASAASASETAASSSAGTASTKADEASASATSASNSETAAAVSASAANASAIVATDKATLADNSATASASSAADSQASADSIVGDVAAASGFADAAAASYDEFDDRYLGAKASDPALDNDGNALLTGAIYWDTTASVMKVYTGSVWTLVSTAVEGVYLVSEHTNIAGQSTITITYDVGLAQVLYNGVQLAFADFTATNGTTIVLTSPVSLASDIITIILWGAVTSSSLIGTAASKDFGVSSGELPLADNVVLKDSLTGAGTLPAGTTAERPGTPAVGMVRYNATNAQFEG